MIDIFDNQYGAGVRKKFSPEKFSKTTKKEVSLSRCCRLFTLSRQAMYQRVDHSKVRSKGLRKVKEFVLDQRL